MTFFEPEPAPPEVDDQEQDRDPQRVPPFDEIPAIVPIGARVARTAHVAIVLASAHVFSDGIEFHLVRHVRRGDLPRRQFEALTRYHHLDSEDERNQRLRSGVQLSDGQRVVTTSGRGRPGAEGAQPRHTLVETGGGGDSSGARATYRSAPWLHPHPPTGTMEFVVQWLAVGIEESRTTLSADELLAAVPRVGHLWQD